MPDVTLKVGDRFHFAQDGVFGTVSEIFTNDAGEQASAVIKLDDGKWAAVDLSLVSMRRARLH